MLCKTIFLLVIAHFTIGAVIEAPVDYSQHKIVRILPNRVKQLNVLEKIKTNFNVEFWNHPMKDLRPILTVVSPKQMGFLSALNHSHIRYEIAAHNFQKVIDAERQENEVNRQMFNTKAFDYENSYHTYAEIVAEMQSLASSKVAYGSVGTSFQGRSIPYVTIGSGRTVFLECGIHSREWVSTASCLWMMNALINDASLSYLTDKFKFIIVPMLNVDGYVYTHTNDRMWRKTRTTQSGTTCIGADPNRNWDTAFCQQGASTNPCSETYCGRAAFSEPCSKAMSELIAKETNIAAYFAIHSYSQIWMYPWGYTNTLPPNNALLNSLSTAACNAIKAVNGLTFTKGSIANAIYLASGSSIDWAYDKANARIAFALELRDKGQYGFILPPAQIKPACLETWAGIKATLDSP